SSIFLSGEKGMGPRTSHWRATPSGMGWPAAASVGFADWKCRPLTARLMLLQVRGGLALGYFPVPSLRQPTIWGSAAWIAVMQVKVRAIAPQRCPRIELLIRYIKVIWPY